MCQELAVSAESIGGHWPSCTVSEMTHLHPFFLLPLNITQGGGVFWGVQCSSLHRSGSGLLFVWLWRALPAVPPSGFLFIVQLASGRPPAGRKPCA